MSTDPTLAVDVDAIRARLDAMTDGDDPSYYAGSPTAWCYALLDALAVARAEVERLTGVGEPAACDMKHQPPMDFAYCETHDTTFPLGGKCRFQGREAWEVYADEADEQRGRAVMAEMEADAARAALAALREAVGGLIAEITNPSTPRPALMDVVGSLRAVLTATPSETEACERPDRLSVRFIIHQPGCDERHGKRDACRVPLGAGHGDCFETCQGHPDGGE